MRAAEATRRFVLVIFAAVMISAGSAADPDPPENEGQGGEVVVIAEPAVIDLGRVPTCGTFRWTLRLINIGPEQKRVTRIGTPSECGIGRLPGTRGDHIIPPHSLLEVEIAQRVGALPGPIRQDIIALVEDHPPVEVLFGAEAVGFVSIEPGRISLAETPDGRVTVRSRDGQRFRIARVLPPLMEPTEEPSAEHTLVIDWDRWREADRPSSFALETDHPLCPWALGWIGPGAPVPPMPWDELDTGWDAPVFGVPKGLDLGEIPTSTSHELTFYLVNTGDEPRHASGPKMAACDCTKFPDGKKIFSGRAIRIQTRLASGTTTREIRKHFNPGVASPYRLLFEVRASVISYVAIEPLEIDFYEDPEPCIRVYSVDGQPFRIRSVFPMICGELPEEAAVEHLLHLDWQRWCESRHQRRMLFTTDHPLCRRVYARLKCGPF